MMPEQKTPETQKIVRRKKDFCSVFGSINECAFIYNEYGQIVLANPVAISLLGLSSTTTRISHPYSEYIHLFDEVSGQPFPLAGHADPLAEALRGTATAPIEAHGVLLQQPDGQMLRVDVYCALIPDNQESPRTAICIIHQAPLSETGNKKPQQIIQALLALMGLFPMSDERNEETQLAAEMLTSPDMQMITQSIIDLLRSQLSSEHAWLLTIDAAHDQVQFIAMSGSTPEQAMLPQQPTTTTSISDFIGPQFLAQLMMQEILVLPRKDIHIQTALQPDTGPETFLCLPLFVFNHVIGCLILAKSSNDINYSEGEIELVKAMSMLITLILKQFHLYTKLSHTQAREQALNETYQRMNEFLDLASHELCTPLTILMGNLQLAQRRLQRGTMPTSNEQWDIYQTNIQQTLENALQGARIQERMIHDMLDDSRIQTNTLTLNMRHCDLQELVSAAIAEQQIVTPERVYKFKTVNPDYPYKVVADPARIRRVVNTFLRQAHAYSPADRPVTIRLSIEGSMAQVAVHDQGWGIPEEEQELIWERFYRSTGVTVQNELDLSLGLGLYLCRTFVEFHHGAVGVVSHPQQGATFWFTIPMVTQELVHFSWTDF